MSEQPCATCNAKRSAIIHQGNGAPYHVFIERADDRVCNICARHGPWSFYQSFPFTDAKCWFCDRDAEILMTDTLRREVRQ